MFDSFVAAMIFAGFMFLVGLTVGILWATEQWERGVIEHGFGIYCPNYGEFAYINDVCKPLPRDL